MSHLVGRCDCGRVIHYSKGASRGASWTCYNCGKTWYIAPHGDPLYSCRSKPTSAEGGMFDDSGYQNHRNHRSPVQTFQDDFRREVSRVIRKSPLLQATEYCAEVMLDAGSQLVPSMESVYSLLTSFKGYSYYDHGHPFKN